MQKNESSSHLASFFLLALGITALCQMPGVLAQWGYLPGGQEPYMPLVVLGVFGPFIAAYVLERRRGGKEATRALLRTLVQLRPGLGWMLLALVLPGLLLTGSLLIARLFGSSLPLAYPPDPPAKILVAVFISVGEEVGWRGYALPRLSQKMGRVRGTIVLGAVWTVWHFPMFLGQGVPVILWPVIGVFLIAGSFAFTWIYFRTGGSLLIAVLFHVGSHLNNSHAALPDVTPLLLHTCAWIAFAIALLLFDGKLWRHHQTLDGAAARDLSPTRATE